jgi:hypothetical protein
VSTLSGLNKWVGRQMRGSADGDMAQYENRVYEAAAALLRSVLAGCGAGEGTIRPVLARRGRRRWAGWSAEAHRECFEAVDEAARTPAQR